MKHVYRMGGCRRRCGVRAAGTAVWPAGLACPPGCACCCPRHGTAVPQPPSAAQQELQGRRRSADSAGSAPASTTSASRSMARLSRRPRATRRATSIASSPGRPAADGQRAKTSVAARHCLHLLKAHSDNDAPLLNTPTGKGARPPSAFCCAAPATRHTPQAPQTATNRRT